MSKSLIVITGLKRSGKDTFADRLVSNHGYIKAQPLACFKPALQQWFGFTESQMNDVDKEKVDPRWGFSPRELMQVFGTELMREDLPRRLPEHKKAVGDALWALVFKEWYLRQGDGRFALADWRFPVEREILSELDNVTFIRILNNRCANIDTHVSEKYISTMYTDYDIVNNGSLGDYYKTIDNFADLIN